MLVSHRFMFSFALFQRLLKKGEAFINNHAALQSPE